MNKDWWRENRELTRSQESRNINKWPCGVKDNLLRKFIDLTTAELIGLMCDFQHENPPSESTINGLIRMCYILGDPEVSVYVKKVVWSYSHVIEWCEENRARHWDDYWRRMADGNINLGIEEPVNRLHDGKPFQFSDTSQFADLFKGNR